MDRAGAFESISTDEKAPGIYRDSGSLELVAGTGFNPLPAPLPVLRLALVG